MEGRLSGLWYWIEAVDAIWKCRAICFVNGGDELGANDI
jgi:hypothetical protein